MIDIRELQLSIETRVKLIPEEIMAAREADMAKTKPTDVIKVRQAVRADAATVWACLLEPRAWWNNEVDLDARPGGVFTEPWTDEKGKRHVTRGSVIAFHPPHGLVLAWADEDWRFDTVVAMRIENRDGASQVSIDHEGWRNAPAARRLPCHRSSRSARTRPECVSRGRTARPGSSAGTATRRDG